MKRTSMDMVAEVINMTCNELIEHLRSSFTNESGNSLSIRSTYDDMGCLAEQFEYSSRVKYFAAFLICLAFAIY